MHSNRLVAPPGLPENVVQATRAACRSRTSPDAMFVVPRENEMLSRRRDFLAGAAGMAAMAGIPAAAWPQAKPRVTFISQWSAGSDGAAITGLGKRFEEEGGIWQHSPVPGFTTEMMNKLRAEIIAGDPPAASQLKGPEIAAWSKIAPTVDLDAVVAAADYEKVVPAELVGLHKPQRPLDRAADAGLSHQHAVPVASAAMDKAGATKLAGDMGGVQRAGRGDEGRRHHPGRQRRHPLGRRHEVRDRPRRHQPRRLSRRASCSSIRRP